MRLIDANSLLEWIDKAKSVSGNFTSVKVENIRYMIDSTPTINPEDLLPKGKWEEIEYGAYFKCSECGYVTDYHLTKFCPNCGAKMEG